MVEPPIAKMIQGYLAAVRRSGISVSQACRQQYGFNSIFLVPVNLCGPGDNFDPASSHVISALIKSRRHRREP